MPSLLLPLAALSLLAQVNPLMIPDRREPPALGWGTSLAWDEYRKAVN